MEWTIIGIIGNCLTIGCILIMRVQYLQLCDDRDRWESECRFAQSSRDELGKQIDELQTRLGKEQSDHTTLLARHSKKCDELYKTLRELEAAYKRIEHLESKKPNLPKNYLSLIEAMQACTRFISSNQWMLEQSKELTSAVAALADVADRIECEDQLCPR